VGFQISILLIFIINHPYPPQFIGFICNYKKSSRYVEVEQLNELLKLDKKKSNFVAVLVRPDEGYFRTKLSICLLIIIKFMTAPLMK
jgi:phosphoribosylanthranilate isomerase